MQLRPLANSLIFRVVAIGLFLMAVALVTRLALLTGTLRESIQELVGTHLLAVATYVAGDIDGKVRVRQRLLEDMAKDMPLDLLQKPRELESWLARHHALVPLFSLGMVVVPVSGHGAIADSPPLAGRRELDFSKRDWFHAARDKTRFVVGKPEIDQLTQKGIIIMAAPIQDKQHRVVAVIYGTTALDTPGFLDLIQNNVIGRTGGYLLISPHDDIFVAATMPKMRLRPLPPPGANRMHDLAMAGYRGTGITVNAFGIEELVAFVSVTAADWFVVARMPSEEAFEPVEKIRDIVRRNGLAISLALAVVFIFVLVLALRPMNHAAREMRRMAAGEIELQRLPVTRGDEIGTMIASFNQLVDRLRLNEASLKERSDALEKALGDLRQSEARMTHMAHHDPLTGLPNRALFEDRLHQALMRAERNDKSAALLFLDLDGFKPVNDHHGHEAGDEVLRQLTARFCENLRRADTVARLGGDEFVVLLADLDDARGAATLVAAKCLETIAPDFLVGELRLSLGLSIGIAIYPDDAAGAATLLAHADQAMYRAKQNGRGRYEFFRS
ncbi:MAG: diguanylate cyclase [Candidatus Accumulibacter phosphatis]|nr:diguanylate cyclase [Candidatus Accumulibacter phosphatis]